MTVDSVRAPTVREVARLAGVAPTTVSRVLTGRGYVAGDTAARVRAAFDQLGYQPNYAARQLRTQRSNLVGVTLPSLESSVHRGAVAGLEEVLRGAGYQVLLGHLGSGTRPAVTFFESVRRQQCDGYAIVPSRADSRVAPPHSLGRPAVVVLSSIDGLGADHVVSDGTLATREATNLLLDRLGGPVAFIGVDSDLSHDLSMLLGYRQAIEESGQAEHVVLAAPHSGEARQRVLELLSRPVAPRGFLFASSLVVFEGIAALIRSGLRVGEDVGVVTVASEERPWVELLPETPPLLVIPAQEIGRRAADLLLRRLQDDPSAAPRHEVIPMRLEV